jgi:polyhydroxyalkanoate synthesis regulator phasin
MSGQFYLGKLFDITKNQVTGEKLEYDPADLTTHAVVTGMTGSGKTGLCIALMEEAALQGIPAILIDPKGDLTNLLLHFPDLAPQEFQPWLDPDIARRAGKTLEQAAEDAATVWKNKLAEWDISRERILTLKNAAEFAIYTPGSDAGLPISVLASLAAPELEWASNREILSERISSTVTAILGLVGFDNIDPLKSREHILISNIFQNAWSHNQSLDLTELILQTQTPPFDKLGAFPVDTFFPAKDRMGLALQINNILAAPTFDMWRSGDPLEIGPLLFTPEGRPRQSVFYLAHLSDEERMFFVTILFTTIETWMRKQAGSTSLRALLYMDEIFGYLPPSAIPPSKEPLLRMLKQGRAFGLGLVLATQNPVDLDYKALSNAGTWFIGKLQTERDKQRLLDGLESAAPGALDRSSIDKLISALGKRIFLMQNVHEKQPVVFETRWTMNFLAGPMTRAQIPALNELAGARVPAALPIQPQSSAVEGTTRASQPGFNEQTEEFKGASEISKSPQVLPAQGSTTRPPVPAGYAEFFLPVNQSFTKALAASEKGILEEASMTGILYRPVLMTCAQVRFIDRKYGLNTQLVKSALVTSLEKRGPIRWEDFISAIPEETAMDPAPDPQGRFAPLEGPISDARQMTVLQKDFAEWAFRSSKITIRSNPTFGLFATPEVSQAEFMKACAEAARERRDNDLAKVTATFDRQIAIFQDKIAREERELEQDQTELSERKREEFVSGAETVFSLLGGKRSRRISEAMSKHRMTEQSKADVDESEEAIDNYKKQLAQLEQAREQALNDAGSKWGDAVNDITEIPIPAKKADVYINLFGVAWFPYYQINSDGQTFEIPAYQA